MLMCQQCRHQSPDGSLFCDQCGTALAPVATPLASRAQGTPTQGRTTMRPAPDTFHPPHSAHGVQTPTPVQPMHTNMTPLTPIPLHLQQRAQGRQPLAGVGDGQASVMPHRLRMRLTNGKIFELTGKSTYLLGRRDPHSAQVPDIDLSDWNGAASGVSRVHAAIYVTTEGIFIEDLESLNETIHNKYRLLPRQAYRLADGDELQLGSIILHVVIS